jgi:hypothetical protein
MYAEISSRYLRERERGEPRHKWEDNIKIDLTEIGRQYVDLIQLVHYWFLCLVPVNQMSLQVL